MTHKLTMLAGFYVIGWYRIFINCLQVFLRNLMARRCIVLCCRNLFFICQAGLNLRAVQPLPGDCLQRQPQAKGKHKKMQ